MGNDKTERVVMLMLDNKDRVIGCETLGTGTFSSVKINTRKIADICVMRGVSKVAFAHNHPRDNGAFSINDHVTNSNVEMLCSMLDVEFLEHFVIMGDGYFGIKRQLEDSKSMSLKEYMKNNGFDGEL